MGETNESVKAPRRRGRKLRRVLLGLVVLLLVVVVLLPTLAGPIARPIVEGAVNDRIKGRATISKLGLSWLGSQRVELTLDDPGGGRVADVTVRADRGLLGLAAGSRRLGRVFVRGEATIVRDADGETNLQRAIEARFPAGPDEGDAGGEPAQLPGSLAASVVLDGLRVTYADAALASRTDGAVGAVRLGGLSGSVDFAVGSPVRVSVSGPISTGRDIAGLAESGSLGLELLVSDLTDASGTLTLDAMSADAEVSLRAPALEVALHAGLEGGAIVRKGETRVALDVQELAGLLPAVGEALAGQPGVEIDGLPTVELVVSDLRLPTDGDLRRASASVRVSTTAVGGTVELPGGAGASRFGIEPLELSVIASSLAETVSVTGGTRASIDGESAGSLSVDLAVGGLLDEAGKPRSMPGSLSGGFLVEGFSTPILQPFVAALNTALPAGARLDLPQDLGPTVDLALGAEQHTDGSGAYDVDLSLRSEHAKVDAAVVIDGQRVASRGDGLRASVRRLAPMLDRFTAAHGVRVSRGAHLTVNAGEFSVDLSKLGGEAGPDLRGTRAALEVSLVDADGQMQLLGDDELRDVRVERVAFGLSTDDLDGEVRVTADVVGRVGGEPFATVVSDMTLAGLLDDSGAPATGSIPSLRGETRVSLQALGMVDRAFGGLYRDVGLVLAEDIGPAGELVLLAAPNPAAGSEATDIDVNFTSAHVSVTAPLTATPDRLRTREPIAIVDRAAGGTLSRLLAGRGPVGVRPGGAVRVSIGGLDVPLEGGVRPDRVAMSVSATVTGMSVELTRTDAAGAPMEPGRLDVDELVATVSAAPGAPPRLGMNGSFTHARQAFTLTADSTLHGVFDGSAAVAGDPMSVVSLGSLRPETVVQLVDAPATLARLASEGLVRVGGEPVDLVLLTRDTLGRTFGGRLETSPHPDIDRTTRLSGSLTGERASVEVVGAFLGDRVRVHRGDVSLGVTPRVARHLTDLIAADAPVKPALTETATVALTLGESVEVLLNESYAPDLSRLESEIDARVTLTAALDAVTLPAAEGGEGMVIPPVKIDGLTVGVVAPGSVLGEAGGTAEATVRGVVRDAAGEPIVRLAGSGSAMVRGGKPEGAMPVSLALNDIAGAWIDALLEKPALVTGALGETFSVALETDPDLFVNRDPKRAAASVVVTSPRFSSAGPIEVALGRENAFLLSSVDARWVMGPRWANLFLLGSPPGGVAPSFAFTEQTPVRLEINRAGVSLAEGSGLFKPDVFIVNATVTAPSVPGRLSDGRLVALGDLGLRVGRGPTPEQLGFALTIPKMRLGDQAEVTPDRSRIAGVVSGWVDAGGDLTLGLAEVSLSGGIAPIPTEIIDAFARQNGLLRDALGPTVDFSIDANGLSKTGGSLLVKAETPQASATIKGEVGDGVFVIDPKASPISVSVITPELAKRFQKALPMVASFEKTREDDPLRVVFETPLELPMDGNMDRLNGRVTIDIGTARFGTSSWFERVLAVAQQKTAGQVGRRMPPMKITIDKGLVSYEPYKLPFGEFTIETAGAINLSSTARQSRGKSLPAGQLEVMTFIPTGAVASEAVPALRQFELPVVGDISRLPVRTSGPIAQPSTNLATDMMGRELIETPGRLLQDLLGGG